MTAPDPFSLPPATPEPRRRNVLFPILIGGGLLTVILLIVVGGAALAFTLLTQRANNLPELLPAETQIYATFTPNLSDLPNIERLRQAFPETFDYQESEATSDLLAERFGVTFAEDIAPWIGTEMAIALYGLPIEALTNLSGLEPADPMNPFSTALDRETNILLLAAVRDQRAAQAFLDKQRAFREQNGERFTTNTINNVTIYASESDTTPFAAFALARNTVVFANKAENIATLVQQENDSTLARNTSFQAVIQALPGDRMATIYISGDTIARLTDAVLESYADTATTTFNDVQAAAQALQGVGLTMAVIERGLRFDAVSVFDQNRLGNDLRERIAQLRPAVSPERAGDVDSAALGVFSFLIPEDWGQQLRDQLAASPETANTLDNLESSLNIDFERDLFRWFHGEGVITVLPLASNDLPVGGYFALRVADRSAAEQGMERISAFVADSFGLVFTDTSLGRTQVQAIEEGDLFVGYGFNGNDLVIAFGRQAMESAFGAEQKLSSQSDYADALRALPSPNSGILHVNLTAVRELYNRVGTDLVDPDLEQRLAPFKAITSTGTVGLNNQGALRGTLLLSIGS
ncbi:DUF3352 domain-containing protein [Chloroflexus sp.]|uniref:DUF3352 domain-containing protein n=1 Tax=Chloroflexus sp. TaxID=1904827 RepID=UPI002ADD943C|nr:DUF3352 domain-containing protein [Chloroflexus sp.]